MPKFPAAKKKFGQHFLHNKKVIEDMTTHHFENVDEIIEVGPGPGVLTKPLSQLGLPLTVIEMDESFAPLLNQLVAPDRLILADAVNYSWEQLPPQNYWVVSNLPYNASVVLFIRFLKTRPIKWMHLMFQKEVAQRIFPTKRNSLGPLAILAAVYFDIKVLAKVSPGSFSPAPKVDSWALQFVRKATPLLPFEQCHQLESFCRRIFQNRRKQLGHVLKTHYGASDWELALSNTHIDKKRRAEALSLCEVLALYQELKQ